MPDQLNKQSLVNLLIDSPLREPIKINLIDIVNNTPDPDLAKIFPTIIKELEIFQKATDRRLKLAEEIIAKLGGVNSSSPAPMPEPSAPTAVSPSPAPAPVSDTPAPAPTDLQAPTLDLPPMPSMPSMPSAPVEPTPAPESPTLPPPAPLGETTTGAGGDEAALAEIQKELDSLKDGVASDAVPPAPAEVTPIPETPAPAPQA